MKIVLDTNVLVSGLLKPYSSSGTIVRLIAEGEIQVVYDARILTEYREVLSRKKFDFKKEDIEPLLSQLEEEGFIVTANPVVLHLPDHDDEPFLEAARAFKDVPIVTGNKKHFPKKACRQVKALNPTEFIDNFLRKQT